jgi:hypothetical protein
VWCETAKPDLEEAKHFAEGVHKHFPGKLLAYNCSPSFNWRRKLDDATIGRFQRELGAMGYKFQFVTLAGFHALNYSMFELARQYRDEGMTAYSRLQQAEFLRFGSIHRNSYLNAPAALTPHLSVKDDPRLLFAGQLTGVEGYTESAATGILAGINLARLLAGEAPVIPPPTTMLGALYRYLRETAPARFQPMNANFGLIEPLENGPRDKFKKKEVLAERALREMETFVRAKVGSQDAAPLPAGSST